MKPQHINPAEAVQIHREVRSMRSVACHLATFWCAALRSLRGATLAVLCADTGGAAPAAGRGLQKAPRLALCAAADMFSTQGTNHY